tara:strand:+ start:570 stop:989 length:420 start_codon:yes stop_codon:yes gene_type:complete
MKQSCKVCGRPSESEYCFRHKPRKPLAGTTIQPALRKTPLRRSAPKGKSSLNQDHLFFKEIWNKRPHRSEISGVYLGKEPSSAFFHHILPKNKYPQIRMDEENIILLTLDEHADVESDMYKFDIINQRRTKLLKKYELH